MFGNKNKKSERREQDPQVIVTGYIEPNSTGGEVIKFNVNLGFFQLKCIVTVPCEGEESAPVYIKFRTQIPKNERSPGSRPEVLRHRRDRGEDERAA